MIRIRGESMGLQGRENWNADIERRGTGHAAVSRVTTLRSNSGKGLKVAEDIKPVVCSR